MVYGIYNICLPIVEVHSLESLPPPFLPHVSFSCLTPLFPVLPSAVEQQPLSFTLELIIVSMVGKDRKLHERVSVYTRSGDTVSTLGLETQCLH